MAEFTEIKTQEELDKIINERLKREKEKYKDYETIKAKADDYEKIKGDLEKANADLANANENIQSLNTSKAELESKTKAYETSSVKMKIAREVGLPVELADKLTGEDEDAIKADAENLYKFIGDPTPPPLSNPEGNNVEGNNAVYADLLRGMKGDN